MKRIIALSLAALVCVAALAAPKPRTLKSPDGRIVVTIDGFKYSVTADGQQMLSPTEVGMTLTDGTVYGGKAKLQKIRTRKVDENINTVIYKKAVVRDRFNELTLEYKDFSLIFRAYNEGVAYRFVSKAAKRFNVCSFLVRSFLSALISSLCLLMISSFLMMYRRANGFSMS